MIEENANIGTIKHEVLYKVAKLAFEDELQEKQDKIPYDMIPGPQANFRCCIYKEREIIRQRVRLAQGKSPSANRDNKNIVQVINSACEGCPITRFVVTDNCQKCMSKKCQRACNFNAISMSRDRAYIDPNKCRECGKCANACPYNAIADLMRPCKRSCPVDAITMDENNIVKINEEKCINCGSCIKDCPFGAISDRSFMVDVINVMKTDTPVYAMIAPALEGQFGKGITMGMLGEAVKKLGFTEMVEVSLGGDLVAASEAAEWSEAYKEGKKMTTSCCPAFVNMIKKHYPQVISNVSTTVSPMLAVSRLIKTINPLAVTVFIGPCVAKKGEVLDSVSLEKSTDYALTADELYAMFKARGIEPDKMEGNRQEGSLYGKRFGNSGGVTSAVIEALKETGKDTSIKVKQCNGGAECKKALMLLKLGKLPEDFIEGMVCEGGCVNGPGSYRILAAANKDREELLSKADNRKIYENLEKYSEYEFSMHK